MATIKARIGVRYVSSGWSWITSSVMPLAVLILLSLLTTSKHVRPCHIQHQPMFSKTCEAFAGAMTHKLKSCQDARRDVTTERSVLLAVMLMAGHSIQHEGNITMEKTSFSTHVNGSDGSVVQEQNGELFVIQHNVTKKKTPVRELNDEDLAKALDQLKEQTQKHVFVMNSMIERYGVMSQILAALAFEQERRAKSVGIHHNMPS